jgi:hypothetical protein
LPVLSSSRHAAVLLALALVQLAASARAQSHPRLPVSGDLLLRGRPFEGVLVLHGGMRDSTWLTADALVFAGANADLGYSGDVMVMSVEVRDPNGYATARLGRFILSTGAVRPVQIDGARVLGRAPIGTSLEVFAGVPVAPELGPRSFDWLLGARAGQQLWNERCVFGASFLHRRDRGQLSDQELGADLAVAAADWLSFSALGAFDLTARGVAEARAGVIAHDDLDQLELFVSHRVAARLLPATSLFSVISDTAGTQAGAAGALRLFPRLELAANAAIDGLADEVGYSVGFRSTLFLSELEQSRLAFEATRRALGEDGWTGAAVHASAPFTAAVRGNASVEVVAADHPADRGTLWPWVRVGASHVFAQWRVAAAVGFQATPRLRSETYAMMRIGYQTEVLP